jgi:hypothetical protein
MRPTAKCTPNRAADPGRFGVHSAPPFCRFVHWWSSAGLPVTAPARAEPELQGGDRRPRRVRGLGLELLDLGPVLCRKTSGLSVSGMDEPTLRSSVTVSLAVCPSSGRRRRGRRGRGRATPPDGCAAPTACPSPGPLSGDNIAPSPRAGCEVSSRTVELSGFSCLSLVNFVLGHAHRRLLDAKAPPYGHWEGALPSRPDSGTVRALKTAGMRLSAERGADPFRQRRHWLTGPASQQAARRSESLPGMDDDVVVPGTLPGVGPPPNRGGAVLDLPRPLRTFRPFIATHCPRRSRRLAPRERR